MLEEKYQKKLATTVWKLRKVNPQKIYIVLSITTRSHCVVVAEERWITVRIFVWITSSGLPTVRKPSGRFTGLQITTFGLQVQTVRIFFWITSFWITDRPDCSGLLSGLLTGNLDTGPNRCW